MELASLFLDLLLESLCYRDRELPIHLSKAMQWTGETKCYGIRGRCHSAQGERREARRGGLWPQNCWPTGVQWGRFGSLRSLRTAWGAKCLSTALTRKITAFNYAKASVGPIYTRHCSLCKEVSGFVWGLELYFLLFLINKLYFQLCLFYPSALDIICVTSRITLKTPFSWERSVNEPGVLKQKQGFVVLCSIVKMPHILERLSFIEEEPGAKKKSWHNAKIEVQLRSDRSHHLTCLWVICGKAKQVC